MDVLQSVELFFIWLANGLLVVLFWTLELAHLFPLLTLPAVYLLVTQASREQRPFGLAAACLAVLAAVVVPLPIPGIIAVMAWPAWAGLSTPPTSPPSRRNSGPARWPPARRPPPSPRANPSCRPSPCGGCGSSCRWAT